jgi:fructosamine-3-kinase
MFEGEHASLNAIHDAVPSLCPQSFAWGRLEDLSRGWFLVTEFLDLGGGGGGCGRSRGVGVSSGGGSGHGKGSGMSLAAKLARLHSTPAPVPDGYDRPMFGFPVTTFCGNTPQENGFLESWADFFAQRRLLAILQSAEKKNGKDAELRRTVEMTVDEIVPRLLGQGHLGGEEGIKPVVVHGDLWSGNKGQGRLVRQGEGGSGRGQIEAGALEAVVYDPSACYAHSEYDHGIMNMFGGFDSSFWKEYRAALPKTVPENEYEDRVALYESYHHLNHYAIFGGNYKAGAMRILKGLLKKYGT